MPETEVDAALNRMSLDELRVLAKRLGISGYSALRKGELINRLTDERSSKLQSLLFPNWWTNHHNHFYGAISVIGVILTVIFFIWPQTDEREPAYRNSKGQSNHLVTIQKPISFADYAAMTPAERKDLFSSRVREQFVWGGYLFRGLGFEPGSLINVPFDTDIVVQITPTRSATPQLIAECQFGKLYPTDSGSILAARLQLLTIGQRLRLSGRLGGNAEAPVLQDASLEAVFPMDE